MLMAFKEPQFWESQVFYVTKVYAFQVRFADENKALYCFMEKSEVHVEMIELQERFLLSFIRSHHQVLKKAESKLAKYFRT